ncbi:MAG: hypothetical protein II996_00995 [Oscillospiraceae bacterium]|nr:hypothetical protein [Oscillospiraceae bacterium]
MLSSFFLGANSGHGFHSLYKELIDLKKAKAVYILKGGPGSGKSSLMKKVAKKAESLGYAVERIYCSSDPDSLDGIIIPTLSKAIVDGTAPHVVEPVYPIAVERYVNLGQFADCEKISEKKDEIIKIKEKYSGYFQHVYRLTACAEHIDNELFDIALGGISVEKLHAKAKGIISREISGKGICKNTRHRFASAISPKGYVHLPYDSAHKYSHIYVIEDSFGLGHFIFTKIIEACEKSQFECTVCHNPLKPERIEHLIIPELALAFITSTKENPFTASYYRKIRLDNMIDKEVIQKNKQRITLLRKTRNSLIDDACDILREAKLTHDRLEDIYNPYIDFDMLYKYADELADEILQ